MTQPDGAATPDRSHRRLAAMAIVLVLIAVAAAYSLSRGQSSGSRLTTSTRFTVGADTIVSEAAGEGASGYVQESMKQNSTASSDWVEMGASDGSVANLTALVFATPDSSQAHFSRTVADLKGLPGYTDLSSAVSSFQQYGGCYGYGEDVDGIAVANGLCTKGNVFLQVHLVSSKGFSELQADLTSLMGSLYDSVG